MSNFKLPKPITKSELMEDIYHIIEEQNLEDLKKYNLNLEQFIYVGENSHRLFLKLIQKSMIKMDKSLKS